MLNFVVIEDDKLFQKRETDIINKLTFSNNEDIKIHLFHKYTNSLKEIINDLPEKKIYIIDIELAGNYSGIQIAQKIREKDWESEIIFCTSHDKMFENAFRSVYAVFDFIEKFHSFETRLEKDIKTILTKKHDKKVFKYHSRYIDLHLYMKEINYIYRDTDTRKLVIVTDNAKYEINKTITNMINLLDERFKICHRACIINTENITKYNWTKGYFIVKNGETVYLLSKKYKENVVDK